MPEAKIIAECADTVIVAFVYDIAEIPAEGQRILVAALRIAIAPDLVLLRMPPFRLRGILFRTAYQKVEIISDDGVIAWRQGLRHIS